MKILDMQGQPCPLPVVHAKEALAHPDTKGVIVVVDNIVAVQNLEKMAKGTGYAFASAQEGTLYRVTLTKAAGSPPAPASAPVQSAPAPASALVQGAQTGVVVLITADSMGRGEEELGRMLMKGFIFSLTKLTPLPTAVMFLNSGARLTTQGANTIPDLKTLEEAGTSIVTCGTCANYYKLTDALAVGSIVDMMTIAQHLAGAASVITL